MNARPEGCAAHIQSRLSQPVDDVIFPLSSLDSRTDLILWFVHFAKVIAYAAISVTDSTKAISLSDSLTYRERSDGTLCSDLAASTPASGFLFLVERAPILPVILDLSNLNPGGAWRKVGS